MPAQTPIIPKDLDALNSKNTATMIVRGTTISRLELPPEVLLYPASTAAYLMVGSELQNAVELSKIST